MKDTANDMRRELHASPMTRKVIVASIILAVLILGTCALIGPFVSPTNPYDPVQRRADEMFDVIPPEQTSSHAPLSQAASSPAAQDDPPEIDPVVELGDAGADSGQAPPTVYAPPSSP